MPAVARLLRVLAECVSYSANNVLTAGTPQLPTEFNPAPFEAKAPTVLNDRAPRDDHEVYMIPGLGPSTCQGVDSVNPPALVVVIVIVPEDSNSSPLPGTWHSAGILDKLR